jgi:hypothetical protein|tara:strand:- start:3819 stop:5273 length:1455 start_codon:yes stop_codon:yes gene_type:complete
MSEMYSRTENNALQFADTFNTNLDLFSRIGAMRNAHESQILSFYKKAFNEDSNLATRILFWARAAREGAGERKVFHTVLARLAKQSPQFITDNAKLIAKLGYWKDLIPYFWIQGVPEAYATAIRNVDRLACKWAPRKGTHAKQLRDCLKWTNKEYRVWLKENSETVEQHMASKAWSNIAYSSVPGAALRKYKKAYDKHDPARFEAWKLDKSEKASVSASYPHDIFKLLYRLEWEDIEVKNPDIALAQKQWDNLPDYVKEGENILPMCDVSGSMDGLPMMISVSLGLYLAEKNKESFKDTILTFSSSPELLNLSKISGLKEKFSTILTANWGMSTDFEKAYHLILDTAISFNVPKQSMPTMLLVLSDMQFNQSQRGDSGPHFDSMKQLFEDAGYVLPRIVFWNLRSSTVAGSPATAKDDNVALVSGFNPVLMKAILAVEEFNPFEVMLKSLENIVINPDNLPDVFNYTTPPSSIREYDDESDWDW